MYRRCNRLPRRTPPGRPAFPGRPHGFRDFSGAGRRMEHRAFIPEMAVRIHRQDLRPHCPAHSAGAPAQAFDPAGCRMDQLVLVPLMIQCGNDMSLLHYPAARFAADVPRVSCRPAGRLLRVPDQERARVIRQIRITLGLPADHAGLRGYAGRRRPFVDMALIPAVGAHIPQDFPHPLAASRADPVVLCQRRRGRQEGRQQRQRHQEGKESRPFHKRFHRRSPANYRSINPYHIYWCILSR